MKITDALYGEHGLFYPYFDYLDGLLAENDTPPLDVLQALARGLERMVVSHATIEEEGLFAALDGTMAGMGPLHMMRAEHQEIDRLASASLQTSDAEECADLLRELLPVMRRHFMKEEQILFPMAQQVLDPDVVIDLGRKWAEIRKIVIPEA
jgi:iron-sulfur cluster repair protein YtfE (RIC family)